MIRCCDLMDKDCISCNDDSENTPHSMIYYHKCREYFIRYFSVKKGDNGYGKEIISTEWNLRVACYCPFCGAKLPKELSDEWFDILEKEYGIDDPHDSQRDKVPAEFWTDEWWKKRGL